MVTESMQVSARGIFPLVLQRTLILAALKMGAVPGRGQGAVRPPVAGLSVGIGVPA
jgi:hypothetical protein